MHEPGLPAGKFLSVYFSYIVIVTLYGYGDVTAKSAPDEVHTACYYFTVFTIWTCYMVTKSAREAARHEGKLLHT